MDFLVGLWNDLYQSLFADDRWKFYLEGLGNTLIMTVLACLLGILLGTLVAIVKTHSASTGRWKLPNMLCNLYTTVIRGTPVLLQLLIFYFFILSFVPAKYKVFVAVITFGINSGAYAAEIIRAGIQSVDIGQTEAGRSLGLGQGQTMRLIIMPQAIRNILPALFNELITLLKETSVAGYISIIDVTRAGDLIRSRTFKFFPLFICALIYLVIVMGLTAVQKRLEKRMAASDRS